MLLLLLLSIPLKWESSSKDGSFISILGTIRPQNAHQNIVLKIPLNINTLNFEDLLAIPGMTKKMAVLVYDYRQNKGVIKDLVTLYTVLGSGSDRIRQILPYITLGANPCSSWE